MFPHAHRLCLAPMMDRTDRHFRFLLRLIAPRAFLYTEMITARALVHGDAPALLTFDPGEHPVALQLGGADPALMAHAAALGADAGYDEININVGCPSDRVRAGAFGAALMREPDLVAECVRAISAVTPVPVTVKTRLGVDHDDSYEFLRTFTTRVADAGCRTLIVHARKAWLEGLSPRENREIPPLDPARVHRLKRDFPTLEIVVNGGIRSLDDARRVLGPADGVMLGRAAYDDPLLMRALEMHLHGPAPMRPAADVVTAYVEYMARGLEDGVPLRRMARHLMGLMAGRPGARAWRRMLGTLPDGAGGLELLAARANEAFGDCAGSGDDRLHRHDEYRYNVRDTWSAEGAK